MTFFDRLSPKKEALLQVLLEAEGEWIPSHEVRRKMREDYGLSVPDKPGAISSHQGHLTRRYSKRFSRNVIDVQWADEARSYVECRVGEKYEDELREYFNK